MSASWDVFVFQTTQRCHSVFSWRDPLASFHERLVASENVATRFPPVVERTSGSFPRFPIKLTLFRLRLTIPPGERVVPRRARCHPTVVFAQAFCRSPFTSVAGHANPATEHDGILRGPPIISPS